MTEEIVRWSAIMSSGFERPLYLIDPPLRFKMRRWQSSRLGFGVGRTVFWRALMDFRAKKITCDAALQAITGRYRKLVEIFELGKICAA
jgi:myo-inositol catabolism protein IolC